MEDQRVTDQIARHPGYEKKIRDASVFLDKEVRLVRHTDEQGDHIPIGTTGQIIDFNTETFDGLHLSFDGKIDMVYPEEIELVG